jgi:hypothetical protein
MMNVAHVIIPSWASLSLEMQLETGCKYPVMIPLGGKPLYRHIIDFYKQISCGATCYFILATDAPSLLIEESERAQVIEVRLADSKNMATSILAGLHAINEVNGAVVVHTADTLFDISDSISGDCIFAEERSDLYRWTSLSINESGAVKILNDRADENGAVAQMACVGVFTFRDKRVLENEIEIAIQQDDPSQEPFFSAIEEYSLVNAMHLAHVDKWHDCGHIDTFYQSRLSYQNLRHFNSLTYGPQNGQVTKRSEAGAAFRHQVRWFKQVPDTLASFLPRVFDSSDAEDPYITMELLSIPTLGELFVQQRLPLGAWSGVVRTIETIQSLFEQLATQSDVGDRLARSVYLDKTQRRLAEFVSQIPNSRHFWVNIYGEIWNIDRVIQTLESFIEINEINSLSHLAPIHGDFCFSNLLLDSKINIVKMIDPRGEFGVPGIYGDSRYDLAKLMHSYRGHYDFIVSDLFDMNISEDFELRLNVKFGEYHAKVAEVFDRILFVNKKRQHEVESIQSLLFLSMLPLHADKPQRQLAMLAKGLQIYGEAFQMGGRL